MNFLIQGNFYNSELTLNYTNCNHINLIILIILQNQLVKIVNYLMILDGVVQLKAFR